MVKDQCVAKITGAGMGGVILIVARKDYLVELCKDERVVLCGVNSQGLSI